MPEATLSAYVARTREYLQSPLGKANFRECRERCGYSYQTALCAAVMTATHLIVYERISEVVRALLSEELRVVA